MFYIELSNQAKLKGIIQNYSQSIEPFPSLFTTRWKFHPLKTAVEHGIFCKTHYFMRIRLIYRFLLSASHYLFSLFLGKLENCLKPRDLKEMSRYDLNDEEWNKIQTHRGLENIALLRFGIIFLTQMH